MSDDIAARITIAIEAADAVRSCEQVEEALARVTKARQDDLSVAEQSSRQNNESASAVQGETDAISEQAKARKDNAAAAHEEINAERKLSAQRAQSAKERAKSKPVRGKTAAEIRAELGMAKITEEEEARLHQERLRRADEWNRKADEQIAKEQQRKQQQANSDPGLKDTIKNNKSRMEEEKFNAEKSMYEREKAEARAQDAIARRSLVSDQALKKEALQTELLIAKKNQLLAVQKELALQDKVSEIKGNLSLEQGRGRKADSRIVNNLQGELSKYNMQMQQAQLATQRAEQKVRQLSVALHGLAGANNASAKGSKSNAIQSRTVFATIRAGIIRLAQTAGMLRGVPLMGRAPGGMGGAAGAAGGGLFAKLGGAAGFASAGMLGVMAAPAMLATWGKLRGDRLREEQEMRMGQLDSQRGANEHFEKEAQKRQEMLSVLEANTQKERLTLTERVKQDAIIKKLSGSMHGMNIEVDKSTGKIKNMTDLMLKATIQDRKQASQRAESEFKNIEAELQRVESFVNNAHLGTDIVNVVSGELTMAKQQLPELRRRRDEAYAKLMESRKASSPEAIKQLQRERIAKVNDDTNEINRRRQQLRENNRELIHYEKFGFNVNTKRWYDYQDTKRNYNRLTSDIEGYDRQIENLYRNASSNMTDYQRASREEKANFLRDKRLKAEEELYAVRAQLNEVRRFNYNVDKEIKNIQEQARLRQMVNQGLTKEAYYLRIENEAARKMKEQGWSKEQAKRWAAAKIEADKADFKPVTAAEHGAGMKWQSTMQDVVWAGSMQALELQSRMLINNTPQKQMLQVTQKQYQAVVDINRKMKDTRTGEYFEFVKL